MGGTIAFVQRFNYLDTIARNEAIESAAKFAISTFIIFILLMRKCVMFRDTERSVVSKEDGDAKDKLRREILRERFKLTSVGLLNLKFRSNLVMEFKSSFSKSKSVTCKFCSRRDWLLDLGMTARPRWVAQLLEVSVV